ncbi:MAG: hypothetical protein OEN56_11080 [Gemmatimonadota bacterium]|nr:hypothetical protein [Gemmatimonadota bacterium]
MINSEEGIGLAPDRELVRLRELLLGEHPRRIDEIAERLDDPTLRSKEVGAVLPNAILRHGPAMDALPEALEPQVEEALARSIQRDPARIARILSPIIGRAIRRSVRQALAGLAQRVSQTVDHSLTLGGLAMRVEALKTGVPFSEIVLRRSLLYRVEQLFWIHRETGLLLAEAVEHDVATRDPEIVSSMLTVVRDFVRDSMDVGEHDALDAVTVGELRVWVEPGPHAMLAAVIRGHPPESLRGRLSDVLDGLHAQYQTELEGFDGELGPFQGAPRRLARALVSQEEPGRKRMSPVTLALVASAVVLGGILFGRRFVENRAVEQYVRVLDEAPGVEVLETGRRDGRVLIRGLRDPLAVDPIQVAREMDIDPDLLAFRWEPIVSAHPDLVVLR